MGFANKKNKQDKGDTTDKPLGSGVFGFFIPILILAAVAVAGTFYIADISSKETLQVQANQQAEATAHVLASRISDRIEYVKQGLENLLLQGAPAEALSDGGPLDEVAASLARQIPALLQLRLLPAGWNETIEGGDAPLGFAGLDLVKRTQEKGEVLKVEGNLLQSPKPHAAFAYPVKQSGQQLGVLLAAYPISEFRKMLSPVDEQSGRFWLIQHTTSGEAQVASNVQIPLIPEAQRIPIKDTLWLLAYAAAPVEAAGSGLVIPLLAAGLVLLVLMVLAFVMARAICNKISADMAFAVGLGESIIRGEDPLPVRPGLAASSDSLVRLAGMARLQKNQSATSHILKTVPDENITRGASAFDPGVTVVETEDPTSRANVPDHIFRAYDIRGAVGKDLTPELVVLMGQALGTLMQKGGSKSVLVARDARLSSPELAEALTTGLVASGCQVMDLGQAPTPLVYFGCNFLGVKSGIMVTGSHNPSNDNGFKILLNGEVFAGQDLLRLRDLMKKGELFKGEGSRQSKDLTEDYVANATANLKITRSLKLVLDAGNGVAGGLSAKFLRAIGCEVVELFCEPDGNFPNHHPDPTDPANLVALQAKVQEEQADLGIALDGDGDRVVLVDDTGKPVLPEHLLMLLSADILSRHPSVDILYDVKTSGHMAGFILANGGNPVMCQSGHSPMKVKMKETGALLGGEYSGHYYIKENWYGFDDGAYAAGRVIQILSAEPRSVADVMDELPTSPSTPELILALEEGQATALVSVLAQKPIEGANIDNTDGLRVEFDDGWGLVRASNTRPALVFRFEGRNQASIDRIQGVFRTWLADVSEAIVPPF